VIRWGVVSGGVWSFVDGGVVVRGRYGRYGRYGGDGGDGGGYMGGEGVRRGMRG